MNSTLRGLGLSADCVLTQDLTLAVPFFTQGYQFVVAICYKNLTKCLMLTSNGVASQPGEVVIPSSRLIMLRKLG